MKPILHELTHSPFCIPIRRLLEAHRIPYDRNEVPVWDRRALAELTGGYYQVPVIEFDGETVHDTADDPLVVARFLSDRFLGGCLFPDHCAGLQEIMIADIENHLEMIGFKLCDPGFMDRMTDVGERAMVTRHKERSFGAGCVERWRAEADLLKARFTEGLQPYEKRLAHSPFLFGEEPVYADFALYGVVENSCYHGEHELDPSLVALSNWRNEIAKWETPAS